MIAFETILEACIATSAPIVETPLKHALKDRVKKVQLLRPTLFDLKAYFEISVKIFPFVSIPRTAIVIAPIKWTSANAVKAAVKPP